MSDETLFTVKTDWSRRLATILAGTIAVPLIFEIVLALVSEQEFNYTRTIVTVAIVGFVAGLLWIASPGWLTMQRARAVFLVVAGVATAVHGFVVSASFELLDGERTQDVVGLIDVVLGVTIFALGCFYFQVEDGAEKVENPDATRLPIDQLAVSTIPGLYTGDATDRALLESCAEALSLERLHYLAYYEPGDTGQPERVFSVDVFDQQRFPARGMTPHQRRESYHEQGPQILTLLEMLNMQMNHLQTGPLVRLVFDVEQGAVFYYLVSSNPGRHLIAVTLDQGQIHTADAELEELAARMRREFGLLPLTKTGA